MDKAQLQEKLGNIHTLEALDELRRSYFGSKGIIKEALKKLGTLSIEERKKQGAVLNALQNEFLLLFSEKETALSSITQDTLLHEQEETLSLRPVKIGHLHPITQTVRMMNGIFTDMGYSVMEGPEIDTDEYCLQRLNVPIDHPARDLTDTFYIKEPTWLLRSQTSSIEAHVLEQFAPPLKVVIPGRVYRNEKVNKSNHFIFHQYQGVVVLPKTSLRELFSTFTYLFKQMYGEDVVIRFRSKYYPEVEPGAGPDMQCFNCHGKGCPVCKFVGWIEMGGSGMIHPHVFTSSGLDPNKWMGFAFGLGLDRWVMAKYHITDIRSLLGGNLAYTYYENETSI